MSSSVRIWDLPTRLFHWSLALAVLGLVLTAQLGLMEWHFRLGYAVLTLLLFRFFWGWVGGRWSRFSSFFYGPVAIWRYVRGQGEAGLSVGHSPSGALSVYAMLLLLLAQVASGLFSDDEIAASGPLSSLVSAQFVSLATWYHRNVGKPALIVLVAVHIAAILYYLLRRRQNLIRPMLTGDKTLPAATPASRDDRASRLLALALLACSAALVWLLLQLAPGA